VSDHATSHAADLGMAANDSPVGDRIMRACLIPPAYRPTAPLPGRCRSRHCESRRFIRRSARRPSLIAGCDRVACRGGSAVRDLRSARRSI
jgi:hypothetical protein